MLRRSEMRAIEGHPRMILIVELDSIGSWPRPAPIASVEATRSRTGFDRGRVRLRGAAVVAMVQTADLWNGDDRPEGWRRNRPGMRRVLRQREMRPRLVVVR